MDNLTLTLASVQLGGRTVVDRISTTLSPGSVHIIVGPNGAGKSTLLRAIAGLLPLSTGTVALKGKDISRMSAARRAEHIAYLPQDRTIAWNLAAADVAALGAFHLAPELARQKAIEALADLGLGESAETGVFQLSGGQRARILLARLMVGVAQVYVLDEPLVALDPAWQRHVLSRLRRKAEDGGTVILSLHDLPLAAQFADNLLIMQGGELVRQGPPEAVLTPETLQDVFNLSGALVERNGQHQLELAPLPFI